MDKKNEDIETKKLEIEKAKLLEGYLRTLGIILLTIGAGIGTIIKFISISNLWWIYLLVLVILVFIIFGIIFIYTLIKFNKKLKEL